MALPNAQFEGFQPEGFWPTNIGLFHRRGQAIKALGAIAVTFAAAATLVTTIVEQAVTGITNSTVNDLAIVSPQTATAGNLEVMGTGRVSAAGTVQVRIVTLVAGTRASATYFFFLVQVQ